jgi:hypothetical protein
MKKPSPLMAKSVVELVGVNVPWTVFSLRTFPSTDPELYDEMLFSMNNDENSIRDALYPVVFELATFSATTEIRLACAFIPDVLVRITPYRLICLSQNNSKPIQASLHEAGMAGLAIPESATAKFPRFGCPATKACCNEIPYDRTDVAALSFLISWACMIECDSHGPAPAALPEVAQELCRICNIGLWIQH